VFAVLALWCEVLVAVTGSLWSVGAAGPAFADILLPNDPNGHVEVSGFLDVADAQCGTYVRGADLTGAMTNPGGYDYVTGSDPVTALGAVDHLWAQDWESGDAVPLTIDLGFLSDSVDSIPAIDHGPVPDEAIESTVYGSNDPNASFPSGWEVGDISTVFLNGPTTWVSDDFSTRWEFSQPHRYFAAAHGGPKAMVADGDNEIDAVCAITPASSAVTAAAGPDQVVPEGSTVVLNASGSTSTGTGPPLTVPATSNIFAAGQASTVGFDPGGSGPGVVPTALALPVSGVVRFSSVAGAMQANPGLPENPADGSLYPNVWNVLPLSGLSGYRDDRHTAVVGVFLDGTTPSASMTEPATLDFTGNHDFVSLSPALRQVFFIGDGRTAGGNIQDFVPPAGATRLFVGIADAYGPGLPTGFYGDNSGVFTMVAEGPGGPLSYTWQAVAASSPVQLSSTSEVAPSFAVFDEGHYTFEVTASDGVASASDQVSVTVTNVAPTVTRVETDPTATDGLAEVTVAFTDPGVFDWGSISFDWGDGTATEVVAGQVGGTGWGYGFAGHRYTTTGAKTVTVWVTDNDGGVSASQTVIVQVGAAGQGEVTPPTPVAGAALWATSSTANDTIKVTGSNNQFTGQVHSNREIRVSGSQHRFTGGTKYVTALNVTGSNTTFTPAAVQGLAGPAPIVYPIADWRPGGTAALAAGAAYRNMSSSCSGNGNNRKWQPGNVLAAGVYYVNCNIAVSGSNVGGNVTFVTDGTIKVSGSGSSWTPYAGGLLFLAGSTDSRAVDLSGSGHVFHGSMFAGAGGIELTGSGNVLDCGIVATTARVSGSNNQIGGANCAGTTGGGGPAATTVSIGAPPLLVPTVSHTFTATPTTVVPGEPVIYSDTVRNGTVGAGGVGGGARVFTPVQLGVDNPNLTSVTVTGVTYRLETHNPVSNVWSTLATTDPAAPAGQRVATLTTRPTPTAGVTYPTVGNLLDGTVVPAGKLASWAGLATIDLTPTQTLALMDAGQVDAIRNTAELSVSSTNVRRIARFDDMALQALRAAPQANLTNITATVTSPAGVTVLAAPAVPGFAALSPGQSATGSTTVTTPTPAPKAPSETDTGYLARLRKLDNTALYGAGYVQATAGVGPIWGTQQLAAVTRHVPVIQTSVTTNGLVPTGTNAAWSITLTNSGTATATNIEITATLTTGPVTVGAVPATLAPGASVTITDTAPTVGIGGVHTASFVTRWANTGLPAGTYGPTTTEGAVRWLTLVAPVTISAVQANFFPIDGNTTGFTATPATPAVFGQTFPNVAFNPPAGTLPPPSFGVDPTTVPFTNLNVGVTGIPTGTLPAAVGPDAAGVGALTNFQAVFTGTITVTTPGPKTLTVTADDGFTLGIGGGVTRLSGPLDNTAPVTAFTGVPVIGGHNQPGPTTSYPITVDFPAAGSFPFELDYLNLTTPNTAATLVLAHQPNTTTVVVPPAVQAVLSAPSVTAPTGTTALATVTVTAADGTPVPGAAVAVAVTGANANPYLSATTNTAGQATVTYTGYQPGVDVLRASVTTGGYSTVTNQATRTFTGTPTGGPGNGLPGPTADACTPGDGTTITEPTVFTCTLNPTPGTTVTGWTVTIRPAETPPGSPETRTLGTGTATTVSVALDPTVLANGIWTVTITATGSDGGTGTTDTSVIVDGQLKLGRFRQTFNDMSVPVAGIPISVNRTYDTLDRLKPGDFGFGWTLEVANFKVQANKPVGLGGWAQYECGAAFVVATYCFQATKPHFVTVTWPDGRTESFDFTPPQAPPGFSFLTTGAYTRRAGSRGTSTLSAAPEDRWSSSHA